MAATFQRYSQGRVLLNVVTGGESAEQRAYGDFLGDKPQRYRRCAEFLDIVRRLGVARRSAMTVSSCAWRGARLARRPGTRCRRCTSAARRPKRARSRPGTATST